MLKKYSLRQGIAVRFQADAVLGLGVVGAHFQPAAAPRLGLGHGDGGRRLRGRGRRALPLGAALLGADEHAGEGRVAPRQVVPPQRQVDGHALHHRRSHLNTHKSLIETLKRYQLINTETKSCKQRKINFCNFFRK